MPNRFIKESCRTSETLDSLSDAAERMFWRLTTVADDFGRFEADPRILLANCFPLRVGEMLISKIAALYQELAAAELVGTYKVGKKLYGVFFTWDKHQRGRASTSKFPAPPVDKSEFLRIWESEQNQGDVNCCQTTADVAVSESESESESVSEKEPKTPSAPVKVKELRPQTEADDLVRLAAEIGQLDKVESRAATQKALIQWVISMLRKLDKEPQERKQAVARASLEQVRHKLRTGYEIKSIWGLLNKIFDAERTKYMQGPENESFKNAPMGQFGAVMDKIRAGEKQ